MIKLCILEAGFINPALENQYPRYSKLFKEFLSVEKRNWQVSSFEIYNNKFPRRGYKINVKEYNSCTLNKK